MTDTTVQNGSAGTLESSILKTIKKLIGFGEDYDHFDMDLMVHINSTMATLSQLGVGPADGFEITGDTETWQDYLGSKKNLNSVKTYIYMKARLIFDTPATSFVIKAFEDQIRELEFRLNVTADPYVPIVRVEEE